MVCAKLLAQTQFGDQGHVTVCVLVLEVIEQFTTTADHAQQAAAAVVVFGVGFEVGSQLIDTGGQQSDLDFRATGVFGCTRIGGNDFGFDGLGNHRVSFN